MRIKTATIAGHASFDGRIISAGTIAQIGRTVGQNAVMALVAVGSVALAGAAVTTIAAWLASTSPAINPQDTMASFRGPGALTLAGGAPDLAKTDSTFDGKWAAAAPRLMALEIADAQEKRIMAARAAERIRIAALAPPPPAVPLPMARPHVALPEIAQAPVEKIETKAAPFPQIAMAIPAPAPPPPAVTEKRAAPQVAHNKITPLIDPNSRTAVYDISARTVYMPNGEKLEAHSGLYDKRDDPRFVRVKMHGATPPNVYELTLREALFHGVRAIRLNPVDEGRMYGRAGILAHTYMLGPNGQSNGCVSFKDYNKFLQAFLRGEVDRMVVVPEGGTKLALAARPRHGPARRYAAASYEPAPARDEPAPERYQGNW